MTIKELAAGKVAEIEASCIESRLTWLATNFGLAPTDFEREGMEIQLCGNGEAPFGCWLEIKLSNGKWSSPIMNWEDLHNFFEGRLNENDYFPV